MRASLRRLAPRLVALAALTSAWLLPCTRAAADELPEYRLKAAFVYNFIAYTQWPDSTSSTLHICTVGEDPFGKELDGLAEKTISGRAIAIQRKGASRVLGDCDVVYVSPSAMRDLPRILESIKGRPILTIADSIDAAKDGIMLNMAVSQDRVTFEANQRAARTAGLVLSSRLLKLATEVSQ
jgi:hypothetical protein